MTLAPMTEIVLTSSVLILAVLVIRFLFRKSLSQRFQYALWLLVLVRLLVPFNLPSLQHNVLTVSQPATQAVERAVEAPVYRQPYATYPADEVKELAPSLRPGAVVTESENSYGVVDSTGEQVVYYRQRFQPAQIMAYIWYIGMAVIGVWLLVVNLGFYIRLCKTRRLLEVKGCKRKVFVTGTIPSPCLFGFPLPAIYLTPKANHDPQARSYSILHEETHAKHLDPLWALLRGICLTIYWFHPLVWVAAYVSKIDCELACDEGVLAALPEAQRIPYGETLVSLIPVRKGPGSPLLSATTMTTGKKQMKERITRIAQNRKPLLWALAVVAVLAAVICAVTFTGAEKPYIGGYLSTEQLRPQLNTLYRTRELWAAPGDAAWSAYAVTDLDQDGQIEVIAAWTDTDGKTENRIYEVQERRLTPGYELSSPNAVFSREEPWPLEELTVGHAGTLRAGSVTYPIMYHFVPDGEKVSWLELKRTEVTDGPVLTHKFALTFGENGLQSKYLGRSETTPDRIFWYDGEGDLITRSAYDTLLENTFPDYNRGSVVIFWMEGINPPTVDSGALSTWFQYSYNSFALGSVHSGSIPEPTWEERAQLETIAGAFDTWKVNEERDAWAYAVTDLDQNGRLEIVSTENHGTESVNTTRVWEVSEDGKHLLPCPVEGFDLIFTPHSYFYAQQGEEQIYEVWQEGHAETYTYLLTEGEAHGVTLKNGSFTGQPITDDSIYEFEGYTSYRAEIKWVVDTYTEDLSRPALDTLLQNSWMGFQLYPRDQIYAVHADLDHDGKAEVVTLTPGGAQAGTDYTLRVTHTDGSLLWEHVVSTVHVGWEKIYLVSENGISYLLTYLPTIYQGNATYSWSVFFFQNGEQITLGGDTLEFQADPPELHQGDLDAFSAGINQWLQRSVLLVSTDQGKLVYGTRNKENLVDVYHDLGYGGPKGTTFYYIGPGFGGQCTLTLYDDSTFQYYPGALSSYIGMGTYSRKGNLLTLTEPSDRTPKIYRFREDWDGLHFLASESDELPQVDVREGDMFVPYQPNPFEGIMGLSGYSFTYGLGGRMFGRTWVGYLPNGSTAPIAHMVGDLDQWWTEDLDGDGLTELICNNISGGQLHPNVTVYRRRGDTIEAGSLDVSTLRLDDVDNQDITTSWAEYDQNRKAFVLSYTDTQGRTREWITADLSAFTFETFFESSVSSIQPVVPHAKGIKSMILDYVRESIVPAGHRVYWGENAPEVPQEGDEMLSDLTYLEEQRVYEATGAAYSVALRSYSGTMWTAANMYYAVFSFGQDGQSQGIVNMRYQRGDEDVHDVILSSFNHITSVQFALQRDGYPQFMGLGGNLNAPFFNSAYTGEPTVTVLEDAEPIYNDGDYWARWETENFSVTYYHYAQANRDSIQRIDTTRTDVVTYRGVRVGSTRTEVKAAYPADLHDTPYWDFEGDYLWYSQSELGYGGGLIFFFENDRVSRITLIDYID